MILRILIRKRRHGIWIRNSSLRRRRRRKREILMSTAAAANPTATTVTETETETEIETETETEKGGARVGVCCGEQSSWPPVSFSFDKSSSLSISELEWLQKFYRAFKSDLTGSIFSTLDSNGDDALDSSELLASADTEGETL